MITKKTIDEIFAISRIEKKRSGRNRLSIMRDMVRSRRRYGTTAKGYLSFGFAMLEEKYKADYLSSHILINLVNQINRRELDSKWTAYTLLQDYYKRDCVHFIESSDAEIEAFLAKHDSFFAKQVDSTCGKGVLYVDDHKQNPDRINMLKEGRFDMLEEPIKQHPLVNAINDSSINTVRFATFLNDDLEVLFLPTIMRVSANDSKVDNIGSGGFYTLFDDEGIVQLDGFFQENLDVLVNDNLIVESHPRTGFKPLGFKLPYYQESKALVEQMAKAMPALKIVGWDIAIGEDGPDLVELNAYPDLHFNQNYYFTEILNTPSVGAKKKLEEHLNIRINDDYSIERL